MRTSTILHYRKPPNEWLEGLPLGNGRLAAMVMGYPAREKIGLNHEDLWHRIADRKTRPVARHLKRIRALLQAGKWRSAARLLETKLQPFPPGPSFALAEYQPAADLVVDYEGVAPVSAYRRELDLARGVVRVEYTMNGAAYTRECFVAPEPNAVLLRLTTRARQGLRCVLHLEREVTPECVGRNVARGRELRLTGRIRKGPRFEVVARVFCPNGQVVADRRTARLRVTGTRELVVFLQIEVGGSRSQGARRFSYARTLQQQAQRHGALFGRCGLELAHDAADDTLPADQLVETASADRASNRLYEMIFNMGRHLLIASSPPGARAATLQGKWNHAMHPPWQSDYHLDINVPMNYWAAEVCGLGECAEPLFRLVREALPEARRNARHLFGCRGVMFPIAFAGPAVALPGPWVGWTAGAGWLAQHFWWHYEYTLDRTFLRDVAYPYLKEVAAFYEDFLFKNPQGEYEISPSVSPENIPAERGVDQWTGAKLITRNATMDVAVIREVLTDCLTASEILGIDQDRRGAWWEILEHLPAWPLTDDGMLKEWARPEHIDNAAHRHYSHLHPLFPGDLFTFEKTPGLMEAARKALRAREAVGCADLSGWSYVHMAALHARLGEGDAALRCLQYLARACMMPNGLTVHNDWRYQGLSLCWESIGKLFQIEAILGAPGVIAEMLLQSHHFLLRILPALPKAWPAGQVRGLRARGGFEVDIAWQRGRATMVKVRSRANVPCRLTCSRTRDPIHITCQGRRIPIERQPHGVAVFPARAGQAYTVRCG